MSKPVIGWLRDEPVPNGHQFNEYLQVRNGRLFYQDLDLAGLFIAGDNPGGTDKFESPLELVYLPRIRENVAYLQQVFAQAISDTGYAGKFIYAYASKANTAEEVVRTVLDTGVAYEISSATDVEIIWLMKSSNHLTPERMVLCNGFKQPGSQYARNIVRLRQTHEHVVPIIEDPRELETLVACGLPFEVGLRQKSYGSAQTLSQADAANSRFGMPLNALRETAQQIAALPNIQLVLYHAMVGSQITQVDEFITRLRPFMEIYAQLRQQHPALHIFDYGGGIPSPLTLNFDFDYNLFARRLLQEMQKVCDQAGVPVPDILGEMGRYTVAEHGAHIFKVIAVKDNDSPQPWYIINGSIMSNLPDVWALSEHFIVLPLTNLDQPFRRVQLGGITCDSDDIYPPHSSQAELFLPVSTEELYIGFFGIGAYQEMLGGAGGSKHCVIPEAMELVIERDMNGNYQYQRISGQTTQKVLSNLGYRFDPALSPGQGS